MAENEKQYSLIVQSLKGQLPSLPLVMDELLTIVSDPDVALYAIRDIIKTDPSIYTNVLKIANTVEYRAGESDRITNLDDAMQKIGLEKVKRISLNTSVLDLHLNKKNSDYNPEKLWVHSVGVGLISSKLSDFLNFQLKDHAYTCGLIHDIGKLAKFKFNRNSFENEVLLANERKTDIVNIEKLENGIRHAKLGAMIVNSWGISPIVELVTKWHHEEDRSKRDDVEDPEIHRLIDIVLMANIIVNYSEFGNSGHNHDVLPSRKILKRLRMNENDLNEFLEDSKETLEREKNELSLFFKN